jgi:hypothetical protein
VRPWQEGPDPIPPKLTDLHDLFDQGLFQGVNDLGDRRQGEFVSAATFFNKS